MRLIIFFLFISSFAFGQTGIKDHQIISETPFDSIQIMINDTNNLSGGYKYGMWIQARELFSMLGDRDWYKLGTTLVPNNTDSMSHNGYVLFEGIFDGEETKVEVLKEGYLQFDADSVWNQPAWIFKGNPLQTGVGAPSVGMSYGVFDQAYGTRKNNTMSIGINPSSFDASSTGIYLSFEGHYSPSSAMAFHEFHLIHRDSLGDDYRPISWIIPKSGTEGWIAGNYCTTFDLREPNLGAGQEFIKFQRSDDNQIVFRMKESDGDQGVDFYLDANDPRLVIGPSGTMPSTAYLSLSSFYRTWVSKLNLADATATPDVLLGRAGNNDVGAATIGTGLDFVSGELSVDVSELTLNNGWHIKGTSTPPSAITDTIFRTAPVGIGVSNPTILLKVGQTGSKSAEFDGGIGIGANASSSFSMNLNSINFNAGGTDVYLDEGSGLRIHGGGGHYLNLTQGASTVRTQLGIGSGLHSYFNTGGNVIIGGTVPAQKLHVVGQARITDSGGTATTITGRDADEDLTDVGTSWGIDLTSGNLVVDSSEVATQYDLTLAIGGGMMHWFLRGEDTAGQQEITDADTVTFLDAGIISVTRTSDTIIITGTEVDGSITNEIQDITLTGTNPYVLDLADDATDVTFEGAGIITLSEGVANTLTITGTEVDGSITNEGQWTIDATSGGTEVVANQEIDFVGGGINTTDYNTTTNVLTITGTEVDGSTSNELNTIEEANVSVQTGNTTIDYQTLFDVAADGAGEVNVSLDMSEATTVTTAQADDYMLMHDSGAGAHEKMLWSDFVIDIISFEEDNANEGSGNTFDFGTGIDLSVSGVEADVTLDLSEFATDAALDGDEYVILSDPNAGNEKILASSLGGADGNGIYTGDGTVPTDVDAAVTDSLEFGTGILKIINATTDVVGIGQENPTSKLHIRNTSGGTFRELELEDTGPTVEILTKAVSPTTSSPFTLTVQNKDSDIDISGDYYTMGSIAFTKASATLPGGTISFAVGYDSLNSDQVLSLNSRATGATDGFVTVAGGLRYKWASNASSSITLNLGDYGLTTTAAGTKTITLPDAVSGIVGQFFMIYNSGAGTGTVAITGGSGDAIHGDVSVLQNESIQVHCPAANVWVITN